MLCGHSIRTGAPAHRRTGASALLALAAGLSHADLHLVIPSEGPLPLYFSSTSSRIGARAWLSGNSQGFESFRLKLNGEVVYGKTFDPQQGELPSSWRAHVMFDSTHWGAEATSCVVRLEAKEVGQPEQHAEATVPIKNRAAGYVLSHFVATGDSLTPTMDALEAMGYVNQAEVSAPDWTSAQCLGDVAGCTVFYMASHGHFIQPGKSYFGDGTAGLNEVPPGTPVYSLVAPGSSNEVRPVREASVGTNLTNEQLPPFNPTGNPPIASAWVDSCNTGIGSEFLPAFCYPEKNFYSDQEVEDQAEMGWKWQAANALLDDVAAEFWYWAKRGVTVKGCRDAAAAKYAELYGIEEATEFPYLVVYGDLTTRLKDVWTGDQTVWPVFVFWRHWFRIVSAGVGA